MLLVKQANQRLSNLSRSRLTFPLRKSKQQLMRSSGSQRTPTSRYPCQDGMKRDEQDTNALGANAE